MNRGRKLTAMLAVVGLLAACGDDSDDESSATTGQGAPTTTGLEAPTTTGEEAPTTTGQEAPTTTGEEAPTTSTGGEPDTSEWTNGPFGQQEDPGEPVDGGQLSMSMFSEPGGLDPIVAGGGGFAGGTELGALYDVLLRYDYETGSYEPQLAESFESNDDSTVWTVTLRDGVEFTDGTPLDAAAVKASIERFSLEESNSKELVAGIANIETPDDRTVVFNLTEPFAGFPFILSGLPGMIVSPTAVEQQGEAFAQNPVGAGPFMFDHWNPGSEIVLTRNPDYWGEPAHIDSVRFVVLGAETSFETLEQGDLQTAYLIDSQIAAEARDAGFGGVATVAGGGDGLVINAKDGRPAADVRLRQALGYAIDPQVVYERTFGDGGVPGNFVVAPTSTFFPGVDPITPDPDEASRLIEEVKTDTGWDGTLLLTCDNSPARTTTALTVQAQLEAVGVNVDLNTVDGIGTLIGEVAEGNFDVACYGLSVDDALPYDAISRNLGSTSAENRGGYSNADMDAAIADLKLATENDEVTDIIGEVQRAYNADPPFITINNTPQTTIFANNVHGIVLTVKSQVLIGEAWISE